MKGIKLNGRFLDLKPGTSIERERKSPFFAINEYASDKTNEPLTFPYTPNNSLALDMPYQYYSERQLKKYQVEHYSGKEYRGKATLVIDTGTLNLNNIEDTEMKGFLVYEISNFFQAVKGKKLSDLKLGGKRTFNYTTNDADDGSPGYWQHFHETWTNDTIPYIFFPVRNENYNGENGSVEWMNKLDDNAKLSFDFYSPLVPFIRLKYLLEQIFAEVDYQVDFSGLNDSEWEKLVLLNLKKLDWAPPQPVTDSSGVVTIQPQPARALSFELNKHVPQEKLVSDLIVQLFNRFGWAPLFDPVHNICYYVAVKEADKGTVKDWTKYAEPIVDTSFNEETKVFAFANEIDSNDELPSPPDFSNLRIGLPAAFARFLPTPTSADEGLVRFCYHDNQWWQVKLNETSNQYEWAFFADNIYDDEPAGTTDTIATTISTLPVYDTEYREQGGLAFNGLFPAMKHEHTKNIGYRLLLYHGMVTEQAYNGTPGGYMPKQYPFASSTREDPAGTAPLTWSNVYRHFKFGNTIFEEDFGIRKYWWSRFLDILQAGETPGFKINLPLTELIQFSWNDKILIKNIPYLVKSIIEPDPYPGYVRATLKRLTKAAPVVVVDNSGNVVSGVYAKMVVTFLRNEDPTGLGIIFEYSRISVLLYSDQGGTIPYTPPATLYVYVQANSVQDDVNGHQESTTHDYYGLNAAVNVIIADTNTKVTGNTAQVLYQMVYTLDPAGAYGYEVI